MSTDEIVVMKTNLPVELRDTVDVHELFLAKMAGPRHVQRLERQVHVTLICANSVVICTRKNLWVFNNEHSQHVCSTVYDMSQFKASVLSKQLKGSICLFGSESALS